tara:strand:+ start:1107 stop:1817 length:711 start_codon:yes stop_codon:yes gene_type:complete
MNEHFSKKDLDAIKADLDENYFTPIILDSLDIVGTTKNVCDIGCGNGVFTIILKKLQSCNLVGVDGSEYALSKANDLGFDSTIKINDFSKDKLPFENNKFDLVVNKDVLEHLVDPYHLIKELFRITKKNGYALIHVPNHFPILGRLKFLFSNNIDTFKYFPDAKRWNFPHIRFYTKESILELIKISGFSIEKDLSFYFGRLPIFWRLIPLKIRKFIFNRFSNSLCEGFTFLAKKVK